MIFATAMNGNSLHGLWNILNRRILGLSTLRTVVNDVSQKKLKIPRTRKPKATPVPTATSNAADLNVPKNMKDYFETNDGMEPSILKQFPANLLRKCSQNTERFYIANRSTALRIADALTHDLPPDRLVVEVNPGTGLLTEQLLERNVKNVRLYETEPSFEAGLKALNLPKDALRIADFNGLWRLSFQDSMDNGRRVVNLLDGLPTKKWDDEVGFRLFSIVGSVKFLRYLINSITSQNELYSHGRYEMILAMSPLLYSHIASTKDAGYQMYRGSTIVFQLYFEHEFLGTVPRKHFIPWSPNSGTNKVKTAQRKLIIDGADEWYLVRIVPRKDLHQHLLPDNLSLFTSFVTQHYVSRRNRIIPSLEHWIPNCGARLILNANYTAQSSTGKAVPEPLPGQLLKSLPITSNDYIDNMNIYTEFGELTPSQVLTLFHEFINWPEFHQSPFVQAAEGQRLKLRTMRTLDDEDTVDDPGEPRIPDDSGEKLKKMKIS